MALPLSTAQGPSLRPVPAPRKNLGRVLSATILLFAAALASCGEPEAIRAYEAPKEERPEPQEPSLPLELDIPESWVQQTPRSSMTLAEFSVEHEGSTATMTIIPLGGPAGGALANVNRWRGQVQLAPVASLEEQASEALVIDGQGATLFDLVSSEGEEGQHPRIAVAMLPTDQLTWFFKLVGPEAVVEHEMENFRTMLESVHILEDGR